MTFTDHPVVYIDTRRIDDWETFHDVFDVAFGFPSFYGRNLDAWIDCMTYLDDPEVGMSSIHAKPHSVITIKLLHAQNFKSRCAFIFDGLIEVIAFVNERRIESGEPAVLALSYGAKGDAS
ncbi:MAG: barstar family protein [Planctomycetota bacterium]